MKKAKEKPGMTAEEIRALREKERMDSVYIETPRSKKALYYALTYITAVVAAIAATVGLYYLGILVSRVRSEALPYLWMADNSSGFLADAVTAVINLLLFTVIAISLGFALDINYANTGRPREVWGKQLKYILALAFGGCVAYFVWHRITSGCAFTLTGSLLSNIMYYVSMLTIVPLANVLLYLVLPSAVIRMLLILASDTKEKTEPPLIIACTLIMTFGMMGMSPANIDNLGSASAAVTLAECAACSILYHRTNVVWTTALLLSGANALYYVLSALAAFTIG